MQNQFIYFTEKDNSLKVIVVVFSLIFAIVTWQFYLGYIFFFIALLVLTYKSGIEFDMNNQRFREFTKIAGFTKGDWIQLVNYDHISLKRKNKGLQRYAPRSNSSMVSYTTFYEVLLMHNSQRKYKILYTTKLVDDAKSFATVWSENLKLPITIYGK